MEISRNRLRAYKKTVSTVGESAVALYKSLAGDGEGFLLESYDKDNGRFCIFGTEPEAVIRADKDILTIRDRSGAVTTRKGNPLQSLKDYMEAFDTVGEEELLFAGGLTGCLSYDFIRYSEALPDSNPDETETGDLALMLILRFLILDHEAETLTGIVLEADTPEGRRRGEGEASELVERAMRDVRQSGTEQDAPNDGRIIRQSDTKEQYCEKVRKIQAYIREGHVFQTVLSQRWTVETGQDGFSLYRKLRRLNPSPYLFYFKFPGFEVIGSSPEMLVKKTGNRVETCPIAGTRPRGRDGEEDKRLKQELLDDEKERAEHVMLVDLARNDMGRIAQLGTVKVTRFMEVKRYSHVMHLVSYVEGRTPEGAGAVSPLDLAASFLPAGTLSGAPKIRAMEIIDELETVRRGLYGGASGYFSFHGNLDLCITIRTMIKKGERVFLQAGAGIVLDSVPEKEYEECRNKVMALAKTLIREEEL